METIRYKDLKRLAKQLDAPKQKLALLGDCATQQLAEAIRGESVRRGHQLDVLDADYDQL